MTIQNFVRDFVSDEDKPNVAHVCTRAMVDLVDKGIPLEEAAMLISGIVRAMRDNYGD